MCSVGKLQRESALRVIDPSIFSNIAITTQILKIQIQIYFRPSYPHILIARKFTAPFLGTEFHR